VHQAEDVVVALTLKMAAGGSAKHVLTYSPSFDPILDPNMVVCVPRSLSTTVHALARLRASLAVPR
jgi:hypothetical protein